ncbi:Melatonin receptor type 1A-A [Trichoplax sp. H2]|nr:Melatonin receptor type 1A-A [Trichoplax sp. H2]|eukprot:RDD45711.1 Melatonin receptor type 1A-A [Trichoplax sp. H2]
MEIEDINLIPINSTTLNANLTSTVFPISETFYGHNFFISTLIAYLIIGLVGNGLLSFYMFWKIRKISVNDVQILNLALADFLYVIASALNIMPVYLQSVKKPIYSHNDFECRFRYGLMVAFAVADIFIMTIMAFTRYIMMAYPHRYKNWCTPKNSIIAVMLSWLLAILSASPSTFGFFTKFTYFPTVGLCLISHTANQPLEDIIVLLAATVIYYVMPTVIIGTCYYKIYIIVRKSKQNLQVHNLPEPKNNRIKYSKKETKLTVTFFIIFFVYFISFTPYTIINVLQMFNAVAYSLHTTYTLLLVVCINSIINPYIFLIRSQKFQNTFRRLFYKNFSKKVRVIPASTQTDSAKTVGNQHPKRTLSTRLGIC